VLPSYFRTIGVPIVRGRAFSPADRSDGAPVAIVSESVAQRYWPGQDPLGKRLRFVATGDWPWVTVVGIAADTRYRELTKRWMTAYFPAPQFFYFQASSLAVRVTSDAVVPAITQRIRAIEPGVAIDRVTPMTTLLSRELARPLTAFTVGGGFAVLAIMLAAIGVYGTISDSVRQRRRELAVRSAIGASPADMFRDVFMRSVVAAAVGLAIGVMAAAAGMRVLQSMLYEVRPLDPMVFAAATAALLCIVLFATFFPARLAARTDPVAALRSE
jgi:putative ABC transport system permease protein